MTEKKRKKFGPRKEETNLGLLYEKTLTILLCTLHIVMDVRDCDCDSVSLTLTLGESSFVEFSLEF